MIQCNLTINNSMSTYFLDENGMNNIELSEMLQTKCGWNNPFVSDEVMRGYVNAMQLFVECVLNNHEPLFNYYLAKDVIECIYTAYSFNG